LIKNNSFEVVQEIKKIMTLLKINEEFIGDEITNIVNSDINSLIYFFNNFQKDDDKWNGLNIYDYLKQSESNKSNYL